MYLRSHTKGYIDLTGGKVDVTDPGYDKDTWCRINNIKVAPDRYRCYYWIGDRLEENEKEEIKEMWEESDKTQFATYEEFYKFWSKADIGRVCISAIISEKFLKKNHNYFSFKDERWEEIGKIGVDAGLAGYFPDKPDFDGDEWSKFCNYMYDRDRATKLYAYNTKLGFWTSSGWGDGWYPVYAIRSNNEIVALKIEFC
ncbi:MAG: hypothetical protein IJT36_03525 [Alphaproteobacteria bacterium]|nr:hypothetical protein [Alphaproteobacteria bacterium]